jgi:hypothetical protein
MLAMQPDWFAQLTGFRETSYDAARRQLVVEGDELVSKVNGKRYGIGTLEVATLTELCTRVEVPTDGRTTVQWVAGEARAMHADPELEGALFQVASQFNLLEMTGPACAIAAGAATIYGNYFAPVDGEIGQTRERPIFASPSSPSASTPA